MSDDLWVLVSKRALEDLASAIRLIRDEPYRTELGALLDKVRLERPTRLFCAHDDHALPASFQVPRSPVHVRIDIEPFEMSDMARVALAERIGAFLTGKFKKEAP